MNINDYSSKVKNLANVISSIGAPIDDENLVAVTLNELKKNYNKFYVSIVVQKTFLNFQDLITLFTNEEMRIVRISSNGGSQENVFYSNINRSKGGKTSF